MKCFKIGIAFLVLIHFVSVRCILAEPFQDHIVSLQEVRNQINLQSFQRNKNIQDIQRLLQHNEVQKQLGGLVDLRRIENAVAVLDDKTLEDLANRSRAVNDQLRAGASQHQILIGVVLIAVILVITILSVPRD